MIPETFLSPAWLWLLALLPVLVAAYVVLQFQRKRYAVRFTNLSLLAQVAPRRPGWRRHVAAVLFLATVFVMIIGAARPADRVRVPRERATVIVAIDVSLSMKATDTRPTRWEAAKSAAKKFVQGMPPRFNVGLVSFSGTAAQATAPTYDREAVIRSIDALELGKGTAIGEAVFASIQSIRTFDEKAKTDPPPSHIVLLSDGDNQTGRSVLEASEAARTNKVPVSTIAFGTANGFVEIEGRQVPVAVNKETLRTLANETKGKAYEAEQEDQLSEVYRHIGSSLGFSIERKDVTYTYLPIALLLAFGAGGVSLLWFSRLP